MKINGRVLSTLFAASALTLVLASQASAQFYYPSDPSRYQARYDAPDAYGYEPAPQAYQTAPGYGAAPGSVYRERRVASLGGAPSMGGDSGFELQVDHAQGTRVLVNDPTGQGAGNITIDTGARKLYLSLGGGQAIEYGVGVGREGFLWKGSAQVGRKAEWPTWTPPVEMLKRRPDLPRHMAGGLDNPLGARALYLYKGNRDTMFRIHGTNEPDTIGQAVSSGCIRMMNADVEDLYERVRPGVVVHVI